MRRCRIEGDFQPTGPTQVELLISIDGVAHIGDLGDERRRVDRAGARELDQHRDVPAVVAVAHRDRTPDRKLPDRAASEDADDVAVRDLGLLGGRGALYPHRELSAETSTLEVPSGDQRACRRAVTARWYAGQTPRASTGCAPRAFPVRSRAAQEERGEWLRGNHKGRTASRLRTSPMTTAHSSPPLLGSRPTPGAEGGR